MPKFKKLPVEIEAMQWDGTAEKATEIIDWVLAGKGTARYSDYENAVIGIDTLEGTMLASPTDWVIRGVEGEFYPCKDSIFRATYEQIDW